MPQILLDGDGQRLDQHHGNNAAPKAKGQKIWAKALAKAFPKLPKALTKSPKAMSWPKRKLPSQLDAVIFKLQKF